MERVGVSQVDAEDTKHGTSHVPRGLGIPAVSDFDNDAQSLGVIRMFDGHAKQAICAFLGDHRPFTRLQNRGIKPVEAAHQVGMTDHRFPDPVVVFVPHQPGVNLCQLGHGVGHGRQAASVLGDAKRGPVFAEVGAELFHVGVEHLVVG